MIETESKAKWSEMDIEECRVFGLEQAKQIYQAITETPYLYRQLKMMHIYNHINYFLSEKGSDEKIRDFVKGEIAADLSNLTVSDEQTRNKGIQMFKDIFYKNSFGSICKEPNALQEELIVIGAGMVRNLANNQNQEKRRAGIDWFRKLFEPVFKNYDKNYQPIDISKEELINRFTVGIEDWNSYTMINNMLKKEEKTDWVNGIRGLIQEIWPPRQGPDNQ